MTENDAIASLAEALMGDIDQVPNRSVSLPGFVCGIHPKCYQLHLMSVCMDSINSVNRCMPMFWCVVFCIVS